ncbi:MAG: hypothetical protein ABJE66_21360 [Deltaproteobacteria bacterium]
MAIEECRLRDAVLTVELQVVEHQDAISVELALPGRQDDDPRADNITNQTNSLAIAIPVVF